MPQHPQPNTPRPKRSETRYQTPLPSLGVRSGLPAFFVLRNYFSTEAIAALVQESGAERLVMGFPRNMDGTEGPRAALYREMAATIQAACGMEVVLWDERRTTVEAHQILSDCNYHGKKRKNTVDAVAASLILEGYLAFLSRC